MIMIYLIDDKKDRQENDLGWSSEKLNSFSDFLCPIYTLEELKNKVTEIFQEGNSILYHESFLDNTVLKKQASSKREKLDVFAAKHPSFNLVFFSGSKSVRIIDKNVATLPVSIVYQNLELFVKKYSEGVKQLGYLVFGKNPEIEKELIDKLKRSLSNIEQDSAKIPNQNNLFVSTFDRSINNAVENAKEVSLFDEESDSELFEFVMDNLSEEKYDNIFIPLCFGNTLSDYNGLRLATFIRCIETPNQLSRIFIYGFVGLEYLFQEKYFNILKTKNIQLTDFSKSDIQTKANIQAEGFELSELSSEMKKLKLDPPLDFDDNHSIKNELAIYQWAKVLDIKLNDELKRNLDLVKTNLYFRYWQTINPIKSKELVDSNFLKIKSNIKPKILLIDDEASKGWYEIFAYILGNINGFEVNYLGDGFRNLSRGEIINQCINKIKEEDIDIVILDFRLHPLDYNSETSEENTSVQLLKKIKETNPGIQVIGFSATDKIWNLQYLQQEGIDFFIYKNTDSKGAMHLINAIKQSTLKANPLKKFVTSASEIKKLSKQYGNVPTEGDNRFSSNVESNLEIAFELFSNSFTKEKHRNYAFLQLFLILEEFIKLEDIFEEGSEFIVKLGTEEKDQICVAKNLKNQIETAIKMTNNGKYELDRNNFPVSKKWKRFDTNFIISAILIFRLGNKNSSVKGWTNIYTNRNKKVGHYDRNTPNSFIEKKDIFELLNFILYIMDSNNINTGNYDKGLKRQTFDESIEHAMKNDPRFKSSK